MKKSNLHMLLLAVAFYFLKPKLWFGIILLSLFISVCIRANAQSPTYQWAKAIGGTGFDFGNDIAIDPETGDAYTTGVFTSMVDFDPGGGVFKLTSAGANDIFILKLNSDGRFVWALRMGGDLNDSGFSIAVDGFDNVYVTGQFSNTVDFDPGVGTFNLTSVGLADIFILKIDAAGNFIWAKSMGGEGYDVGRSIAVDPSGSGEVYIKGEFNGTVDFNPGANTYSLTSSTSNNGVFISKLDAFGNFVWALKMDVEPLGGGMGVAPFGGFAKSITVDASGNVYTTGWFHGTADFDYGEDTYNLTAAGVNDIFILKLDTHGKFVWAKSMQGTLRSLGHTIAVDASGNVYTSGAFQGIVDFDPGVGQYYLTAQGTPYEDIFISKLDGAGTFIWAKSFGGAKGDSGTSIVVDPKSGDIYATGIFTETVDFDPDLGIFSLTSVGDLDVFISKLDAYGNFVWAKAIGGINNDYGYSIALSSSGNVQVVGGFSGPSISFDSTTFPNADSSGYPLDIFMAKLNVSNPGSVTDFNINQINVYPSPTKNELYIKFIDEELPVIKITIFNLKGEVVYSSTEKNISQELTIDISILPTAVYGIAIDFNGNRLVKQVVKVQD